MNFEIEERKMISINSFSINFTKFDLKKKILKSQNLVKENTLLICKHINERKNEYESQTKVFNETIDSLILEISNKRIEVLNKMESDFKEEERKLKNLLQNFKEDKIEISSIIEQDSTRPSSNEKSKCKILIPKDINNLINIKSSYKSIQSIQKIKNKQQEFKAFITMENELKNICSNNKLDKLFIEVEKIYLDTQNCFNCFLHYDQDILNETNTNKSSIRKHFNK